MQTSVTVQKDTVHDYVSRQILNTLAKLGALPTKRLANLVGVHYSTVLARCRELEGHHVSSSIDPRTGGFIWRLRT